MFDSPKPLPDGTVIDGFTADSTSAWVVAYAGPCGDPECEKQHTRLYLLPMIGWLHVVQPGESGDEVQLRPAIMNSGGAVVDYLNVNSLFRFIAVIRATDDATEIAKGIYRERYGRDTDFADVETSSTAAN